MVKRFLILLLIQNLFSNTLIDAKKAEDQKKYSKASELYYKVLLYEKISEKDFYNLALKVADIDPDIDRSIHYLKTFLNILTLNYQKYMLHLILASLYEAKADYKNAAIEYAKAFTESNNTDYEAMYNSAYSLYESGDFKIANQFVEYIYKKRDVKIDILDKVDLLYAQILNKENKNMLALRLILSNIKNTKLKTSYLFLADKISKELNESGKQYYLELKKYNKSIIKKINEEDKIRLYPTPGAILNEIEEITKEKKSIVNYYSQGGGGVSILELEKLNDKNDASLLSKELKQLNFNTTVFYEIEDEKVVYKVVLFVEDKDIADIKNQLKHYGFIF